MSPWGHNHRGKRGHPWAALHARGMPGHLQAPEGTTP